ncbi:hypothetical protein GCU60_12330 [Blastococcus saxobsidens]|uniref:Uncharacterized protein n=1 Tax=Blastococcus saxobsidens TaxID=138336 RepID=A0A6L9W3F1_9ACTN|nr:hypothetical protein [Blastococcus saxobsidens]NEK86533.1 hypothetical protein [Blastococcus saxobsidens]
MSTDLRPGQKKALAIGVGVATLTLALVLGLLLVEHGPGNMGKGFLSGAAVGLVGAAVMVWRASAGKGRATTFERAWTQTGDERDDAVLTRALAVLGLLAFPLTGAATVAIGLGATVYMVLTLLLVAQAAVGAVSFVVINRRS